MADESLLILMPVFNDWAACCEVLSALDAALDEAGLRAGVLLVDDGSTDAIGEEFEALEPKALGQIDVLRLRRNLGHQRAICIALAYLDANTSCEAVVLMDADGEDDPRDVPKLVAAHQREGAGRVIFAERTRRADRLAFKLFYGAYKALHRILTGRGVRVGNFSLIPRERLRSLVVVPELWNHYAAAVFCSKQPWCTVPTRRGSRVGGHSHMNFTSLVIHGLSAMSVFSEVIGVRLLIASSLLALLAAAGVIALIATRAAGVPLANWEIYGTASLFVILQALLFTVVFSFIILSGRKGATVLPARDYAVFIDRLQTLTSRQPTRSPGGSGL